MENIRLGDTVGVISGKDKGKKGEVLDVARKKDKVLVQGIAMATHFVKPRKQGEKGGITQMESYIAISNVMPICKSCQKPTRCKTTTTAEGVRMRTCSRCNGTF